MFTAEEWWLQRSSVAPEAAGCFVVPGLTLTMAPKPGDGLEITRVPRFCLRTPDTRASCIVSWQTLDARRDGPRCAKRRNGALTKGLAVPEVRRHGLPLRHRHDLWRWGMVRSQGVPVVRRFRSSDVDNATTRPSGVQGKSATSAIACLPTRG